MFRFLLLLSLIFGSFGLYAQIPLVSLDCTHCTAKQILQELTEKQALQISYGDAYLPPETVHDIRWERLIPRQLQRKLERITGLQSEWMGPVLVLFPSPVQEKIKMAALHGQVIDASNGEGLTGVSVYLPELKKGTYSDENGTFFLPELPAGNYRLQTYHIGYERIIRNVLIQTGQTSHQSLELAPEVYVLKTAVIQSDKLLSKTSVSDVHLNAQQIQERVGMSEDPLSMLNQFPGIVSGGGIYEGIVSIRGGEFSENLILLNNAPLYYPMHYLGQSVFNPDVIESIEVLKGGFGANYGQHLSSVINVQTRPGDWEEWRGSMSLHPYSMHSMAEGPLIKGKLTGIVAYRKNLPQQIGKHFDRQVPLTNDLHVGMSWKPTPRHQVQFTHLQAQEQQQQLPNQNLVANINAGSASQTLQWQALLTDRLYSKLSLHHTARKFQKHFLLMFEGDSIQLNRQVVNYDLSWYGKRGQRIRFGGTGHRTNQTFHYQSVSFPFQTIPQQTIAFQGGLYALWEGQLLPHLHLNAGVRYDYFDSASIKPIVPRIALRYDWGNKTQLRMALGRYHQPNDLQQNALDQPFGPSSADHLILGAQHEISPAFRAWVEGYYKRYANLLYQTDLSNDYQKDGTGKALGLEAMLQMNLFPWHGSLSYAWSKSERQNGPNQVPDAFRYQQRHLVALMSEWKKAYQSWYKPVYVGVSLRMGSAFPLSLTTSLFNSGNRWLIPVEQRFQLPDIPELMGQVKVSWEYRIPNQGQHSFNYYLLLRNPVSIAYYRQQSASGLILPAPVLLSVGLQFHWNQKKS